jgi:hypothetical protein
LGRPRGIIKSRRSTKGTNQLSNIPSVIKNFKLRITQLEGYNAGLADESCKQQAKITDLEKEREWIDVIKELPKTTMSVLVTDGVKVGELTYVKYVDGTGKWAGNNKDITAWMLKPKSPEALKEQE